MLTKIKTFVSSLPWWAWVGGIIIVLFLWQSLSGWAMSRKVYDMALDNLRADKSRIVEIQAENQKWYEEEYNKKERELNKVLEVKARSDRLLAKKEEEIATRDRRIYELENRIPNVSVPTDVDDIIRDLNKRGLRVRRHN